jgi:hypothetical protein
MRRSTSCCPPRATGSYDHIQHKITLLLLLLLGTLETAFDNVTCTMSVHILITRGTERIVPTTAWDTARIYAFCITSLLKKHSEFCFVQKRDSSRTSSKNKNKKKKVLT